MINELNQLPAAFITGIFSLMSILLTALVTSIHNNNLNKKAKDQEIKKLKDNKEKTQLELNNKVTKELEILTNTILALDTKINIIADCAFLSLRCSDTLLTELHDKKVLNGDSVKRRSELRSFYENLAKSQAKFSDNSSIGSLKNDILE